VKLQYTDAIGARREWSQGFFASGEARAKLGTPPRCKTCPTCNTCPSNQAHIRVGQDKWFTFESQDLFQNSPAQGSPKSLDKLVLQVAGAQYDVQVANVSVRVHEGKPLFDKNKNRYFDFSMGNLAPWWVWTFINGGQPMGKFGPVERRIIAPIEPPMPLMPPPMPPPTAAPRPTAVQ